MSHHPLCSVNTSRSATTGESSPEYCGDENHSSTMVYHCAGVTVATDLRSNVKVTTEAEGWNAPMYLRRR